MTAKAPLQIGITGGIGSGKSLICQIFSLLGVPVYDADSHAKALMTTDGILVSAIKKEFGDSSYHSDGSLNRAWLGDRVFFDEEQLVKLNNLVHPRVAIHYEKWVSGQWDKPYILKEAALLYETGSWRKLHKTIVVSAPEKLRINRVLKRDAHRTVEQLREIIEKQMPENEKLKLADYVIKNDDATLVIPQVLQHHHRFIAESIAIRS